MKAFTRLFGLLLITLLALSGPNAIGQSILNPADSVITYNPASPPKIPAYGSIQKWVRTVRMPWNTNLWKCYIYNGNQFRLRFPKSYQPGVNDGKLYPMLIFNHGEGEGGTVYDNEYQLFHGGQIFDTAVTNGTFDGYILCMQTGGGWGPTQITAEQVIINYMIANNKLDPFRVTLNGLSGGGSGNWQLFQSNETYIAGLMPMSSVAIQFDNPDSAKKWEFEPIWNIHGGLDGSPAPYTAAQVLAAMQAVGANYVDLDMTTQGHDTWDSTWSMPAFWPWLLAKYSSNPWCLFGRTLFCPGDKINLTVGLTAGFQAYQWRRNGVVISGATSNSITVDSIGTYDARVERGGTWSQWSPQPVVIQYTPTTITPPIAISGLMSDVIPAPDGNTGVTLTEPTGYTSYLWEKSGSNTSLGTSQTYYATSAGQYVAEVTQQYGCTTTFSPAFTVIPANGPNPPSPASGLVVTTLSGTSQVLNWTQNPHPVHNETHFEIYRGTQTGGPYTLIAITAPDVSADTVTGLKNGTTYYYIVRAVDSTAAAANSNEANGLTTADTQPPTAPGNLTVTGSTRSSISLSWTASTDNVGVTGYNVYVDGAKSFVLGKVTTFTVGGLTYQQSYNIYVTAFDAAGNESPASGQVSAEAILPNITYSYFKNTAGLTVLPNYSRLTPASTGTVQNITLSPATQATNFGFLFNGYLIVTTAGTYNFQLTSSDGSKLFLGTLNGTTSPYSSTAKATVNDDSVHSTPKTATSANVTLSVGVYPIAIAYFEGASSPTPTLTVAWKTPGSSSYVAIPNSAFDDPVANNGSAPPAPSGLAANTQSYNSIGLTWTDNSGGQATTEVWRSTKATTGFVSVGSTAAGVSSFTDGTVSPNTTYYYEVRADNTYGESSFSATANATTQPLPAIPAIPSGVAATATSASSISVSWTNTATNAASVQLYRSFGNDQTYVLWATLAGNATGFVDNGLFANATYYYKVQTVNPGGSSGFAPETFATTQDNVPVIQQLPANVQARYGTTTVIKVGAASSSQGALVFSDNLPTFAALASSGDTATITITPTSGNAGTYPGMFVAATDAFGGSDSTKFTLTVNNSVPPAINTISNYTINEGDTLTIPLTGSNSTNPSDQLSFAVANAPNTNVLTQVSNGVASLFVHASYASAGVYTVQVTLTDNTNGLSATQNFTLTVKYKSPIQTILTRMVYQDASALGLPWNGLNGSTTNNLVDSNGNVTTIGLSFSPSTWWNTFDGGSTTGNNSGVYPDVVLKDYNWFGSIYGAPNTITGTLSGMDTSQLYDLTFFANSVYSGMSDNGWTAYTAGGQTVQLHVQNNTHNTVTIQSLKPASNGTLVFTMGLGQNNTQLGYLNALVIHKHYDDGTAPAGISGLTATNAPGKVTLNWTDSAYNATGYEVWRSLTATGNYSLIGTPQGNSANSYVDSTVSSHTGYTYEVRAVNTHGQSAFDSVSTVTQARLPKINPVANIILKDTSSLTVNVTTVDDSTAVLTLTATNLPPFATFTDNGNGTGVLTVTPSPGTVGIYPNVSITVTDALNNTATTTFSIAITEPNVQSIYLSLSGGATSPAPWNSLLTPPFQGTVISNLTDDSGTPTGINATLVDGWYWFGVTGTANGNQNGNQPSQLVYPPSVVGNFIYDPSSNIRRIQFTGLNNAKQYNFVFFGSQWDGTNGLTTFNINGDSVQLQADWNINHTVQLNGIIPVNGTITVVVTKAAAALNSYLGSIVLQAYDTTAGNLLSPADLRALRITQTTVNLQWQDRSAIETGYEVWRATDNSGGYSLLASLPANATTYQDIGLSKNTNYYYIVRAITGSSQSSYSSPLAITTYQDAIYVHPSYTSAGNGPTPPWNNLNNGGSVGASWKNWIDSTGAATSVTMVQTGVFAGPNSLGDVTGNNSGVYPDPVILQQYVLFPGNFGAFTISGLNLGKTYDFTFFGSENYEGGDQNTGYIVNGDTVYLNALYNQQAIVTLHGITPTASGQAFITMFCQGAAVAGWFNAMVINGYTPVSRSNPNEPQSTGGASTTLMSGVAAVPVVPQMMQMDSVVRAYPNPFHTSFTLSVPVTAPEEKVIVALYDVSGNLVYRKEFDNILEGMNYLQVGDDANIGVPGVYMGKVIFSSGKPTQTLKLIKQ